MAASTVNISFQDDLLSQIDRVAQAESRSRSELIREAARAYIEKKRRWESIFAYGESVAERSGLSEEDILAETRNVRRRRG